MEHLKLFKILFNPDELIEFRIITKQKFLVDQQWIKAGETGEIKKLLESCQDTNVYFSVNPRATHSKTRDVKRITSFYIDIDAKDFVTHEAFSDHVFSSLQTSLRRRKQFWE